MGPVQRRLLDHNTSHYVDPISSLSSAPTSSVPIIHHARAASVSSSSITSDPFFIPGIVTCAVFLFLCLGCAWIIWSGRNAVPLPPRRTSGIGASSVGFGGPGSIANGMKGARSLSAVPTTNARNTSGWRKVAGAWGAGELGSGMVSPRSGVDLNLQAGEPEGIAPADAGVLPLFGRRGSMLQKRGQRMEPPPPGAPSYPPATSSSSQSPDAGPSSSANVNGKGVEGNASLAGYDPQPLTYPTSNNQPNAQAQTHSKKTVPIPIPGAYPPSYAQSHPMSYRSASESSSTQVGSEAAYQAQQQPGFYPPASASAAGGGGGGLGRGERLAGIASPPLTVTPALATGAGFAGGGGGMPRVVGSEAGVHVGGDASGARGVAGAGAQYDTVARNEKELERRPTAYSQAPSESVYSQWSYHAPSRPQTGVSGYPYAGEGGGPPVSPGAAYAAQYYAANANANTANPPNASRSREAGRRSAEPSRGSRRQSADGGERRGRRDGVVDTNAGPDRRRRAEEGGGGYSYGGSGSRRR
ncbi:hypothetical protein D9613_004711 [Agrocybe pediades]|uniref:Uncharacterized protein n=1 Tax=Agrocybe pediades TaxID=84607 RepID=A0A8H4R085_9AGAR|nr:hypothetical protein D9613_004711 [Agrocybe pediades]